VQVEIWSDLVCPWCYIGQARFAGALAGFAHRDQVELTSRSFELDPSAPKDQSIPILDMLSQKYGMSREQAEAAERRVAGLAQAEGLPFSANRPHGNTFDAHRLVQFAASQGRQQPVLDALYRTHFGGERSIFDAETLVAVAAGQGLDEAQTRTVLAGQDFADAVRSDERRASELGVTGVPFFVANDRLAVSGAQPSEVLGELLSQAWEQPRSAAG
jgi:predicted DsbA family dithiol-disulfide isomerase